MRSYPIFNSPVTFLVLKIRMTVIQETVHVKDQCIRFFLAPKKFGFIIRFKKIFFFIILSVFTINNHYFRIEKFNSVFNYGKNEIHTYIKFEVLCSRRNTLCDFTMHILLGALVTWLCKEKPNILLLPFKVNLRNWNGKKFSEIWQRFFIVIWLLIGRYQMLIIGIAIR